MTPPRKPASHRFAERTVRSGWVGEASVSQPAVGDRLRSITANDAVTTFGFPVRILRIEHATTATTYVLASDITIVTPQGAQITWEEKA